MFLLHFFAKGLLDAAAARTAFPCVNPKKKRGGFRSMVGMYKHSGKLKVLRASVESRPSFLE